MLPGSHHLGPRPFIPLYAEENNKDELMRKRHSLHPQRHSVMEAILQAKPCLWEEVPDTSLAKMLCICATKPTLNESSIGQKRRPLGGVNNLVHQQFGGKHKPCVSVLCIGTWWHWFRGNGSIRQHVPQCRHAPWPHFLLSLSSAFVLVEQHWIPADFELRLISMLRLSAGLMQQSRRSGHRQVGDPISCRACLQTQQTILQTIVSVLFTTAY